MASSRKVSRLRCANQSADIRGEALNLQPVLLVAYFDVCRLNLYACLDTLNHHAAPRLPLLSCEATQQQLSVCVRAHSVGVSR